MGARWHAVWGAGAGAVGGAHDGVDAFLCVDGRVPEGVQFEVLMQVLFRAHSVEIDGRLLGGADSRLW